MTHANGDIYQGEWQDGKAHGQGVFVDKDGSLYDGSWNQDRQHGFGTEMWNRGQIVYRGDFVEGKKTGKGRFEFDGSHYEGDFVDGKFHGKGKYYFADSGKIYEGDFVENNMHGNGVMVWPDMTRYEGEFRNGRMEGQGIKQFSKGDRYVGTFKEDVYDGLGVWYDAAAQTKQQGEWTMGKRQKWIGAATQSYVSGYGQQQSTQPVKLRESDVRKTLYKGGKWRDVNSKTVNNNQQGLSPMRVSSNRNLASPNVR